METWFDPQRKRVTPHTKVKYNMGSVKADTVKTLSIAFFNIVHYGFSFYRRLDSFAGQGNGDPRQRLSNQVVDVY